VADTPNGCSAPLPQLRTIGQITDSIRAACFLGRHDQFLCADSRRVWQAVADAQEHLHDSNIMDGKFSVGMRLD
jgi:hypothetical protein